MAASIRNVLASSSGKLVRLCEDAITHGIDRALSNTSSNPQEPDLVYGFLEAGVPRLADGIEKLLRAGFSSSVTGLFCHKKPLVTLLDGYGGGCELGDLLVVAEYRDRSGLHHNALLLQAKKGGRFPRTSSGPQWRLYNSWPRFQYCDGSAVERDVEPPKLHAGAQHLLFTPCATCRPKGSCRHYQIKTREADPLAPTRTFSEELCATLLFRSGRPFTHRWDARQQANAGWDEVIWDLLERTATKPVRLMTSGATGDPVQDLRARGSLMAAAITCGGAGIPNLLSNAGFRHASFEEAAAEGSGAPPARIRPGGDQVFEGFGIPTLVVRIATEDSGGLWD